MKVSFQVQSEIRSVVGFTVKRARTCTCTVLLSIRAMHHHLYGMLRVQCGLKNILLISLLNRLNIFLCALRIIWCKYLPRHPPPHSKLVTNRRLACRYRIYRSKAFHATQCCFSIIYMDSFPFAPEFICIVLCL